MVKRYTLIVLVILSAFRVYAQQSAEIYFNTGVSKNMSKDYKGAIESYTKAIELNPVFSEAYYNRGIAAFSLKEYPEAIDDFSKVIRMKPDYTKAYHNRGISWVALKKYKEAMEDYNMAIKLQPAYSDAYYNRGSLKNFLRDYQGAAADFKKAHELNPADIIAQKKSRAAVLKHKQQIVFQDSASAAQVKTTINPTAIINKDSAIAVYAKASGVPVPEPVSDPVPGSGQEKKEAYSPRFDSDPAESLIGQAKMDKSAPVQNTEAIPEPTPTPVVPASPLVKDTKENTDSAEYYNKTGIAKSALKDYTGAIQSYNKALEYKSDFVKGYYNRGIAKSQLGDFYGAITDYSKAIELKPDYAEAYYNRAIARYSVKDKIGGCLDFSKAGELGTVDAYEMIKEYCH